MHPDDDLPADRRPGTTTAGDDDVIALDDTPAIIELDADAGEGDGEGGGGDRPVTDEPTPSRRRLRAGAALGLVTVAAFGLGVAELQERATAQAREVAATRAARVELATQVRTDAAALRTPAQGVRTTAGELVVTLEEHLLVSARSDAELDRARDAGAAGLRTLATQLRDEGAEPLPVPDPLVPRTGARSALESLARTRAEATELAAELDALGDDVTAFGVAVRDVTTAAERHAEVAGSQPASADAEELVRAWEAERAPMEQLVRAGRAAAQVPGLEPWGDAHRRYARRTLRFIDTATAQLRAGEIDAYNAELEATFEGDDPFGFAAAVTAATDTALDAPVLDALARARGRAGLVLEAADATDAATTGLREP